MLIPPLDIPTVGVGEATVPGMPRSRRVEARRCRAGCRRPLRCGGGGSSGTRTRSGHGRFRAPSAGSRNTMDPRQEMGDVAPTTLGWWSWSGRPQVPAIGEPARPAPRPATKALRAEKSPIGASWLALGRSSTGRQWLALRAATLPACGRAFTVRNGRVASSISTRSSSRLRSDHGTAQLV